MKVFTYSEARQHLSELLNIAAKEEVIITRRGGDSFCLTLKITSDSPFNVPAIKTRATTRDILKAVKESRSRNA